MQLNTSPAPCYRALRVFLCFPESRSNFAEQGWSHPAAFLTRVSEDFFPQIFRLPCAHFSHAAECSALQSFSSAWMNYCILMDNLRFQNSAVPGIWCLFLYCVDKTGSKHSSTISQLEDKVLLLLASLYLDTTFENLHGSVSLSLHFCSIIIPVYPVSQEGHSVRFICFPVQHSQAEFQHRWALFLGLYYACSSLDELSKLTV